MLKAFEIVAVLAAVVFAVALFGLIVLYSSQPSNEPEQQQSSEKHETGQEKREFGKSFWQRTTQDPVAFFTLWLAIFTMVLSAVAVIQIKFLVRAEGIATKTAQAAKDSAEVSLKSVSIAKAVESDKVFVEKIDTVSLFEGDNLKLFHFIANSKNMGVTPAVNMTVTMQFSVVNYGEDIIFSGEPFVDRNGVSIGPRVSFKSILPIDASILNAVYAKEKRLGIVFILEFSDIFDPNSRHQTEFAAEVIANINPINIKKNHYRQSIHYSGYKIYPAT